MERPEPQRLDLAELLSSCVDDGQRALLCLTIAGLCLDEIAGLRRDEVGAGSGIGPKRTAEIRLAARDGRDARRVDLGPAAAAAVMAHAGSGRTDELFPRPPSELCEAIGTDIPFHAFRHALADGHATEADAEPPEVLAGLTPTERRAADEIRGHDATAVTELLVCLAADGSAEIDRAVGLPDRVELTAGMTTVLDEGRVANSTHWRGRAACSVLGAMSLYRGRAADSARLDAVLAPAVWAKLMQDVEMAFSAAGQAEGCRHIALANDARRLAQHMVNLEMHEAGLVSYSARLSPDDADLAKRCDDAGITGAVRAAARKRM